MQLAEHPFQVVAPVAVEQKHLADAVRRQRLDQVGDHPAERRRVQVHGQGNFIWLVSVP